MSASSDQRKRIEEKLPHELLKELYLNSRVSIKELERKFGISHHTLSKCLKECEEKYDLYYTLDLDIRKLGFSEQRIVTVKFERMPDLRLLKKALKKYNVVQNAYIGSGDFDLVMHTVGLNQLDYAWWLFNFRVEFSNYRPSVKVVAINSAGVGFLPLQYELIEYSNSINNAEKKVLSVLLKNSRMGLKELSSVVGLSQMRVLYIIRKLCKIGIIKRFTTCVQNPDKKFFMFFSLNIVPTEDHQPILKTLWINNVINKEEKGVTTNYAVIYDTFGYFDTIFFCNFENGIDIDMFGPGLFERVWKSENPISQKTVLTQIIIGKWPFNKNDYVGLKSASKKISPRIKAYL